MYEGTGWAFPSSGSRQPHFGGGWTGGTSHSDETHHIVKARKSDAGPPAINPRCFGPYQQGPCVKDGKSTHPNLYIERRPNRSMRNWSAYSNCYFDFAPCRRHVLPYCNMLDWSWLALLNKVPELILFAIDSILSCCSPTVQERPPWSLLVPPIGVLAEKKRPHSPSNPNELDVPRLQLSMRAVVHRLQLVGVSRRVWHGALFILDSPRNGRAVEIVGVLFCEVMLSGGAWLGEARGFRCCHRGDVSNRK